MSMKSRLFLIFSLLLQSKLAAANVSIIIEMTVRFSVSSLVLWLVFLTDLLIMEGGVGKRDGGVRVSLSL